SARRAFALGLVSGVVYFVGTIYWTGAVLRTFGGLASPLAFLAMLLLAFYLALFPALTALVLNRILTRIGPRAILLVPAVWVATEYLRG
ncbi:apolipoprotein N-acyltransferase, partial [Vibrio parahaemolyticus]|nr:apolipoprotein N-acyltransferase [Vibrio parahaemolyticus]